ncbi:hypothetical protein SESBI_36902 [Sesbania bispinosa]|nr:hypothetical protein SESBI_36902 [Sesbania bispinosa]
MAIADQVGWGGRTTTPTGTPNPTMGSGYFPDDNFVHACYFINVAYQNASRKYYGPETYQTESFTDVPKCYGVVYYGDQRRQVGYCLQFGGPGGCDSAPVAICRAQTQLRGAWNGCTADSNRTGTTAWNSSSWERSEEANRRTAGGTTTYNSMTGGGSV